MEELIKEAQNAYDNGNPIMSDDAFDNLTDSESQFELTEETYTVKHARRMGTINKIHSYEEVKNLVPSMAYVQPKFDGISCEVILNNGEISSISTRGNGEYGKDLSNLLNSGFLHSCLWNPELTSVYAEITLVSLEPSQKDRNVVSGICNKDNPTTGEVNSIHLNIYEARRAEGMMIDFGELQHTYFCNSLQVTPSTTYVYNDGVSVKELEDLFNKDYSNIKRDGIVFKKVIDFENMFSIALKPKPMSSVTKIVDVSWTKGKSKFASTAIIDPINIDGVSISRVTLPARYIKEMNLHIGDYIEVTRAGDVIPRIVRLVKEGETRKEIKEPNLCKYGHELKLIGKALKCSDSSCKSIEEEYLHQIKEILFWSVKRPPRSKLNKLISSGDVTLQNILHCEQYKDKMTPREYELLKQGITNFITKNNDTKIAFAMNIDGLTYPKIQEIMKDYSSIGYYAENSDDVYSRAIAHVIRNKSVIDFIEDTNNLFNEYMFGDGELHE